jgi:hypothetical protein
MGTWLTESFSYKKEHEVVILLKRIMPCILENENILIEEHLNYYLTLKETTKLVKYGKALTGNTVCIILRVASDTEFEIIIRNDPGLDKVFDLISVLPFIDLL